MNIISIIQILNNKVNVLTNARSQAFSIGDLEQVNAIENDLQETKNALQQLTMITEITAAVEATQTTPAELIASGVKAIQKIIQGPSASAIINGYDISAYATDELYEQKIQAILVRMPVFSLVGDMDAYIQNVAPGSPVTGQMILVAVKPYGVDINLLMAIMQNDSCFGTLGIGAKTFNPGNVGNTGSAVRTYGSWQEGISAVAEWLYRHRVNPQPNDQIIPGLVPLAETPIQFQPVPISTPTATPITNPDDNISTTTPTTTNPIVVPEQNLTPTTTQDLIPPDNNSTSTPTTTQDLIPPDGNASSTPISANTRSKNKKNLAWGKSRKIS